MQMSKFALCPIGHCNLDTFRIYEALDAGCVPVVLKQTKMQMYEPSYWHVLFGEDDVPFVLGETWDECQRKVRVLLGDVGLYLDVRKRTNEFWARAKAKWRRELSMCAT
jgi:hypothetical protein